MIERSVCRALLLTPAREVLLMGIREPRTGWTGWITPGGGSKPGENREQTLRREILEETGLREFGVGPHVWHRDHVATWEGRPIRQIEEFFLVRTPLFTPTFEHQPEEIESRAFRDFRWWTVDEIEASPETFVPGRLGALLRDLLENGPTAEPVVVGE